VTQKTLICFKAYDICREINVNIDEDVADRIGRAVVQHFEEGSVVVGFDGCETSPSLADAVGPTLMQSLRAWQIWIQQ
jgi:phosphomannomutase